MWPEISGGDWGGERLNLPCQALHIASALLSRLRAHPRLLVPLPEPLSVRGEVMCQKSVGMKEVDAIHVVKVGRVKAATTTIWGLHLLPFGDLPIVALCRRLTPTAAGIPPWHACNLPSCNLPRPYHKRHLHLPPVRELWSVTSTPHLQLRMK